MRRLLRDEISEIPPINEIYFPGELKLFWD